MRSKPSIPYSDFPFRSRSEKLKHVTLASIFVFCGWCGASELANPEDALRHGRSGLAEYNAGHWQSALGEFKLANSIAHSPVFRLYAARCMQRLGQWIEARDLFRDLAEMRLLPGAPQPWHQSVQDARAELAALQELLPAVRILISGNPGSSDTISLTLDQKRIDESLWGAPIELSPGSHVIVLFVGGEAVLTQSFSIDPKDRQRTIELLVRPKLELDIARSSRPAEAKQEPPQVQKPERLSLQPIAHPYRNGGVIALGIGLLGAAVGTACGVWAWRERDELLDKCGGYQCPASELDRWHRADRLANLATATLVVASANLALGGYLFFFTPSARPSHGGVGTAAGQWSLGMRGHF